MLVAKVTADQMLFLDDSEEMVVPKEPFNVDPLAWKNTSLPLDQRASLLVQAMNTTEKAMIISRNTTDIPGKTEWIGGTCAIERLQIPQINYQDGPQGFRDELNHGTTTAWPSVLAFGQAWDEKLIYEWGQRMGLEFKQKGAGVQLGPGMNVMRVGLNGRDFEYVSGEDPYVGASLVGPLIKGIQSNGILANMKHYINNNQEINRVGQSANIDERTQVEMYMPPFEAAIKSEVASAMCSYNKINQEWSCANNQTLNHFLRDIMGFEGFVMSDWGATHSRAPDYLPNGLDQEQNGKDNLFFTV
jgi:beta-glucosidase